MANSRLSLLSKFVITLWTIVFFKCSFVTSLPAQQSIILNSTANYDTQAARWTFDFNYRLPSSSSNTSTILWVVLKLVDIVPLENNTSSLFAVGSNERFQHVEILGRNSSDQGNVTVYFDQVYSGHFKLKVGECKKSRFSCFHTVHESDLGVVETHLNNIDVAKMNISIRTIPTDIGGINVSFAVQYFNASNNFLPFENFVVSLFHSDGIHSYTRKVIGGQTKAEFRPCNELTGSTNQSFESASVQNACANFPSGEYITRIDPIDSRCNFPEQVVASIKRPCRRYIITNITINPIRFRREGNFLLNETSNATQTNVNNVESTSVLNCSVICQFLNFLLHIF